MTPPRDYKQRAANEEDYSATIIDIATFRDPVIQNEDDEDGSIPSHDEAMRLISEVRKKISEAR